VSEIISFEELVKIAVEVVFKEKSNLFTLEDCSPEELEERIIALPKGDYIAIHNADKSQLQLLAEQLGAVGLPIPEFLQKKLAALESSNAAQPC
jgi:hypothetical protein